MYFLKLKFGIMTNVALADAILSYLESMTEPVKAVDIAKAVLGPGNGRGAVNPTLYKLRNDKKIVSTGTQPPLWSKSTSQSIITPDIDNPKQVLLLEIDRHLQSLSVDQLQSILNWLTQSSTVSAEIHSSSTEPNLNKNDSIVD